MHPVHLVASALVVDQSAGSELADGQEAGALQVLPAFYAPAHRRDERGQGEAGEGVARQEALRGQVPVGVEVGEGILRVLVAQQTQLRFRLASAGDSSVAGGQRGRRVIHPEVLLPLFMERRAIQGAPTDTRLVEAGGCLADRALHPVLLEPVGEAQLSLDARQHLLGCGQSATLGARIYQ